MVLVSGDSSELGLGEDEGAEVLGGVGLLPRGVDVDHVQARLVLVHRVQNHLFGNNNVTTMKHIQGLGKHTWEIVDDHGGKLTWPLSSMIMVVYKLTWPLSSNWLLVSLSLSKETTCFIHWAPLVNNITNCSY